LEDLVVEAKFEQLLNKYLTVDYMGMVEWLLGTYFQWLVISDVVRVHLSQTNTIHLCNVTPDATLY
jgi:hypothetical protein